MENTWNLILEDGAVYSGQNFGAPFEVKGEVVFNTGMTGYVEALTDPSYFGQILVLTYPLIGNYGVPQRLIDTGLPHPFESTTIQVRGLVVARYEPAYSHHAADRSLGEWLRTNKVPAILGVDTRGLTRRLRERGTMYGGLFPSASRLRKVARPHGSTNLVAQVSTGGIHHYPAGKRHLLLVDCGAKHNILRSLLRRNVSVTRVPWDHDFVSNDLGADGLFLSNGPGDPADLSLTIDRVRAYMATGKPIFGICLGHQLLARAAGGITYRLPYGHRSQNQPVVDRLSGRCYITSQNHGYAVDGTRLPDGFYEWFVNANDGTNEGVRHARRPWMSVQFHPEAYPGPVETGVLFDEFVKVLQET